jgi:hypothetical protein
MFWKRPLCFVEKENGTLTAAFVSGRRDSVRIFHADGEAGCMSVALRSFIAAQQGRQPEVVGLIPKSSALFTSMTLPTRDIGEARAMALLQFARSTPHAREDLIVDAVPEEGSSTLPARVCLPGA